MTKTDDAARLIKAARVRHVKRGTEYTVVAPKARLQTDAPLSDDADLVVYVGDDGQYWARPCSEFDDGRFERVSLAAEQPSAGPDAGEDITALRQPIVDLLHEHIVLAEMRDEEGNFDGAEIAGFVDAADAILAAQPKPVASLDREVVAAAISHQGHPTTGSTLGYLVFRGLCATGDRREGEALEVACEMIRVAADAILALASTDHTQGGERELITLLDRLEGSRPYDIKYRDIVAASVASDFAMLKERALLSLPKADETQGEGWRPIETVPEDGDPVDLWVDNGAQGYRLTDARWGLPIHTCGEAGPYCDSDNHPGEPGWIDALGNYALGEDEIVTHWRPLPASPDTKGAEHGG